MRFLSEGATRGVARVQVFELRVAETMKSVEFHKVRSKVEVSFEFDELVGGHTNALATIEIAGEHQR